MIHATTPYEDLCAKRDAWYFVNAFGECRDNQIVIFQEFFSAYERYALPQEHMDACFARLKGEHLMQAIREIVGRQTVSSV